MANDLQTQLWNHANANRWLELRGALGAMLGPFGDAALAALAPGRGERALEVGCGCGEMTVELARRTGDALGLDVSQPLIEVARREAAHGARYLVADAQTHRFEERFDVLYSRFGVMFFDDPAAALANLRAALEPGARLGAAVWGSFEQNTWASVPLRIIREHLPGPASPAPGPGPFSLADPERVTALLTAAGFSEVAVARLETTSRAEPAFLLRSGPAAGVLREAGEAAEHLRPILESAVAAQLKDGARAVALIVSARALARRRR